MNHELTRIEENKTRTPEPVTNRQLIERSQRTAAKVVGIAALCVMAIVVVANYGISSQLIVPGNATDTARNILAHETLFRISIVCYLVYGAGVIVISSALYVIFRPVDRGLALLATLFRLVYALIWVVVALNLTAALRLLHGADYLQVFEADRLQGLARIYLSGNLDAYYAGLPFWGLASAVCAYLWLKSKYIPRGLAAFGVISSVWCAVSAFAFIIFPGFGAAINLYSLDSPMALFEIVTSFWLLFKGLRMPGVGEPEVDSMSVTK